MFTMRLAWRNLWRYPKRTLLTSLALFLTTVAMVFMLSFQIGAYDTMKQQNLQLMDGYGQLQHTKFLDTPSIRHRFKLTTELAAELDQLKLEIDGLVWSARGESYGLLSFGDENVGGMVLGVHPALEGKLSTLPRKITEGRFLNAKDQNSAVVGKELAQHLGAKLGDQIQLLSQDVEGSIAADNLTIVGIFDSGVKELNRQLLEVPLSYFQTLFVMPNEVHRIVLMADKLTGIEKYGAEFSKIAAQQKLAYRDWKALQPGLDSGIRLDFFSAMVWYVAILFIVVLILLNTILMSVLEREREFGLMLSLGMSHRRLAVLVNVEMLLTMWLGILSGILVGLGLVYYYSSEGITIPGTEAVYQQFGISSTLYPTLDVFATFFAPGFFLAGGLLMSFYLSYKLFQLTPLSGRQVS